MANAFQALVPHSAASTSSSSSNKPSYDVFINHRGKDVKLTLASAIYERLHSKGVQVFLDDRELEVGAFFPQAIEEAMRSASVHIAIISPNYVESAWCLEELSFMFQITDTIIIPVFYHVNPSDFHYVTRGIYADKFCQHHKKHKCSSEKPRYKPEKIEEWEEALRSISYLNGCIVAADNWPKIHHSSSSLFYSCVETRKWWPLRGRNRSWAFVVSPSGDHGHSILELKNWIFEHVFIFSICQFLTGMQQTNLNLQIDHQQIDPLSISSLESSNQSTSSQ